MKIQKTHQSFVVETSDRKVRSLYKWLSKVTGVDACWIEDIDDNDQPVWALAKKISRHCIYLISKRYKAALAGFFLGGVLVASSGNLQAQMLGGQSLGSSHNGFTINEVSSNNYPSSVATGDINGDDITDIIVGARRGASGGTSTGDVYVIFGTESGNDETFELADLDGTNGFVIRGKDSGSAFGNAVATGDINGDGFDDIIVGAYSANSTDFDSGESFVIFGKSSGFSAAIETSALDGTEGFRIIPRVESYQYSGKSVGAADINGDGFDDVLIGQPGYYYAYDDDVTNGAAFVVFGKDSGFTGTVNLESLDGSDGFKFEGASSYDHIGASISSGDVNGDGIDDLVVGGYGAGAGGETYVVFGKNESFDSSFDPNDLNGSNGFIIKAISSYDNFGDAVAASDINNDGIDDVIVGARYADPNGYSSGEVAIIFGKNTAFQAILNAEDLDGTNGFIVAGSANSDYAGSSVAAGDVNNDGISDIIIGAYGADITNSNAGAVYVIYGMESGYPALFQLSDLNGENGFFLAGYSNSQRIGWRLSSGDVNNDGVDDILITTLYTGNVFVYLDGTKDFTIGTENNPIFISTPAQLDSIRYYLSAHYHLTADIDLNEAPYNTGSGWEPIGTNSAGQEFSGSLNGNGFTISNLYIDRGSTDFVALFGAAKNAEFSNLILEDVDVTGKNYVGALVGINYSEIKNSSSSGSISGYNHSGGLAGAIETWDGSIAHVFDSHSSATVNSSNYGAGGLVGRQISGTIETSFSVGTITAGEGAGGLMGEQNSGTVTNSFWDTQTSGQAGSAAGTGKTTAEMQQQTTFTGFDFNGTWKINEGSGYPTLNEQNQNTMVITGEAGWRILSAPVSGTSYNNLLENIWTQGFEGADLNGGSSNVVVWDADSQEWVELEDGDDVPEAGTGFAVYVFADDDYNGTDDEFPKVLTNDADQHSGTVAPDLAYTDTSNPSLDGWNLVGNPYGSSISWEATSGWTRNNLDNTFYVWNSGEGEYQSFNGFSGTTALENGLIAPWQGFWVKANGEAPSLSLTDDIRDRGGVLLKKAPVSELRFTITNEDELTNSSIVMFHEQAISGKDRLDAYKLQSLNQESLTLFTQLEDGTALDINALPVEFGETIEIPLDFELSTVGADGHPLLQELPLRLGWQLNALPTGMGAWLTDNETGEVINLSEISTYEFALGDRSKTITPGVETQNSVSLHHGVIAPTVLKAKGSNPEASSRFTLTLSYGNLISNEPGDGLPQAFGLDQNYPNPFNPSTVIRYQLPVNGQVSLKVFDVLGREVAALIDEKVEAGYHQIHFNARDLASGMYIYQLRAGSTVITKKLTFIK